jgi:hypothetical protein
MHWFSRAFSLIVFAGLLVVLFTLYTEKLRLTEEIYARERREDVLEERLVDQLSPGDSLEVDPYYSLLADGIIKEADSDFTLLAEFFAKNLDGAPSSFSGHEFHKFRFFADISHYTYIIIVFENRCVSVVPLLTGGTFENDKDKRRWENQCPDLRGITGAEHPKG